MDESEKIMPHQEKLEALLLALVVSILALVSLSCAHQQVLENSPSWLDHTPRDCAIGMSGPTLNPGDGLRYAQENARHNLAGATLGVKIERVILDSTEDLPMEQSSQEIRGRLNNIGIRAMWARAKDSRTSSTTREVYALACEPGVLLAGEQEEIPHCALGIAGPTLDPDDQQASALEDAVMALAARLETRIHTRIEDDGQSVVTFYRHSQVSDALVERARSGARKRQHWLDAKGAGPLVIKGVMYLLACL